MTTQTLQAKSDFSPLMGFRNLFAREMGDWWRSRRWVVVLAVFTLLIGGMTLLITNIEALVEAERAALIENGADPAKLAAEIEAELPTEPEMVLLYFLFGGLVVTITAVVLAQDAIVGERQQGTAQWVASKPTTRAAFILSKFTAHAVGLMVLGAGAQGGIAYVLLRFTAGIPLNPLNFMLASGMFALVVLFFLALTLMLGTFSDSRAVVAGVPIALLLLFQYILMLLPFLQHISPYPLIFPAGSEPNSLAVQVAMGQPVNSWLPVAGTLGFIVVFLLAALWRYSREEF